MLSNAAAKDDPLLAQTARLESRGSQQLQSRPKSEIVPLVVVVVAVVAQQVGERTNKQGAAECLVRQLAASDNQLI